MGGAQAEGEAAGAAGRSAQGVEGSAQEVEGSAQGVEGFAPGVEGCAHAEEAVGMEEEAVGIELLVAELGASVSLAPAAQLLAHVGELGLASRLRRLRGGRLVSHEVHRPHEPTSPSPSP